MRIDDLDGKREGFPKKLMVLVKLVLVKIVLVKLMKMNYENNLMFNPTVRRPHGDQSVFCPWVIAQRLGVSDVTGRVDIQRADLQIAVKQRQRYREGLQLNS